ncbi:SPOR domain-containing protein [Ascidiimonas aurantiaca]|uniref:SPOR domain-containing protein n=1 Tax=Ascidiimonas aurantiaca TaxID=1685432 RepID=UPI0030EC4E39
MRNLARFNFRSLFFLLLISSTTMVGQEAVVTIDQPPGIDKLMALKTDLNKKDFEKKFFMIQIYNGRLERAKIVKSDFQLRFTDWDCDISFESPNYKVRVGKFRTRLEADRKLIEVKKKYPGAFILMP